MTAPTDIATLIAGDIDRLIDLRHDLHAHPQLCYEETYASETVQSELAALGIPFEDGIAETGVVGWIVPEGPAGARDAVGLRADMDALPITEQTGLPYASVNAGRMHACGHDGHTATLLGAAKVLGAMRDQLPQPVKLFFQPAEEGGAGADRMVKAGALTGEIGGAAVGRMFGLHGWPALPLGRVATRRGPIMAATDTLNITLTSPGGHAAFPHLTADTIVASAHVIGALQSVVSRMIRPTAHAVVSVTQVHGGTTDNIIPDRVEMTGTIRTVDAETRNTIVDRVETMARDIAGAFGCQTRTTIHPGYPVTRNADAAYEQLRAAAIALLGDAHVVDLPEPVLGGEDFAFYGRHVPSCFAFVGLRPAGGSEPPAHLHTPRFDFNDDALPIAVELMCRLALRRDD